MKKPILIAVVGLILILIFNYAYTQERITLSTYYPAPYGEYRKLAIGSSTGGYTAPSSDDIDLVVEGNVGIGTTSPQSKLEIFGDGSTGGSAAIRFNQPGGDSGFSIGLGTADNKLHIGDSWNPESGTHVTIQQNGNIGIGTTGPQAKLHIGGTAGTDGIMFPDGTLQTTAVGKAPIYKVKYDTTMTIYTITGFSSPESQFSLSSFGSIQGADRSWPDGSYLFEMDIRVVNATTKTLYLAWVDNRVDFFLDGSHIAGPWLVGWHRTYINYNLSAGDHTVQIIFNPQGGDDYLALFGDIVDNVNVFYRNQG